MVYFMRMYDASFTFYISALKKILYVGICLSSLLLVGCTNESIEPVKVQNTVIQKEIAKPVSQPLTTQKVKESKPVTKPNTNTYPTQEKKVDIPKPEPTYYKATSEQVETDYSQKMSCCKVCSKWKACGDSCISRSYTCHKWPGCACDW